MHIENHSWHRADDGQTLAAPGPLAEAALSTAITQGRAGAGRIFVWAAGDGRASGDNCNFDGYATNRFGIAVGAVDDTGQQATYSESCSALLVSAPSSGGARSLTTTDLLGAAGNDASDYTSGFGGTSGAAPVVSGVAALMLSRNPALTWRDVQHILVRSSRQVNASDPNWTNGAFPHSEKYGFGVVDAVAAVNRAAAWANVPAESAVPAVAHGPALAIPDNNAKGVSDSITVGAAYAGYSIEHVEVEFTATHPRRGDLEVALTSPSGIVSRLGTVRPGDAGANFTAWRFRSVRHWGESAAGTWVLTVADRAAGQSGVFAGWTLRIYGTAPPPAAPAPAPAPPAPAPAPAAPAPAPAPPSPAPGAFTGAFLGVRRADRLGQLGSSVPSCSANGVGAGTYFVRVRAGNGVGASLPSNEAVLVVVGASGQGPCAGPPIAPTGLQFSVSGSTVRLNWSPASGGPISYIVEAGSSSGRADLVVSDTGNTTTSLTATGVGAGTYFARMRARNACGAGAPSNEVMIVVR